MADKTSPRFRPWRLTGADWLSRALPLVAAITAAGLVFFRWANYPGGVGFGGGDPPVNFDGISLVKGQLVLGASVLAAVAIGLRWHLVAAALSTGALLICLHAFLDIAEVFAGWDSPNVGWALYAEMSAQGLLIAAALNSRFAIMKAKRAAWQV